jgi:hypothetical protein
VLLKQPAMVLEPLILLFKPSILLFKRQIVRLKAADQAVTELKSGDNDMPI